MQDFQKERLAIANQVLQTLDPLWRLDWIEKQGLYFCWVHYSGTLRRKRFSSDDATLFPKFTIPFGSTVSRLIVLMGRWVQGKSVLPLTTIKRWAGPSYLLWEHSVMRDRALGLLEDSDYPKQPVCVFCQREIVESPWDWFSFDSFNGPGCMSNECETRQATQHPRKLHSA